MIVIVAGIDCIRLDVKIGFWPIALIVVNPAIGGGVGGKPALSAKFHAVLGLLHHAIGHFESPAGPAFRMKDSLNQRNEYYQKKNPMSTLGAFLFKTD
jgi:hypothetical protein